MTTSEHAINSKILWTLHYTNKQWPHMVFTSRNLHSDNFNKNVDTLIEAWFCKNGGMRSSPSWKQISSLVGPLKALTSWDIEQSTSSSEVHILADFFKCRCWKSLLKQPAMHKSAVYCHTHGTGTAHEAGRDYLQRVMTLKLTDCGLRATNSWIAFTESCTSRNTEMSSNKNQRTKRNHEGRRSPAFCKELAGDYRQHVH